MRRQDARPYRSLRFPMVTNVTRTTFTVGLLHITADEIHQIGLREVDRIQGEMVAIAKKEGFPDLPSFRASVKTNSKYKPTSAEQILDDFRHYIGQMEPKLPQLFTLL